MSIPWDGLGAEPMTPDEWRAWLRDADMDALEHVCECFPRSRDAADARDEIDRRGLAPGRP